MRQTQKMPSIIKTKQTKQNKRKKKSLTTLNSFTDIILVSTSDRTIDLPKSNSPFTSMNTESYSLNHSLRC